VNEPVFHAFDLNPDLPEADIGGITLVVAVKSNSPAERDERLAETVKAVQAVIAGHGAELIPVAHPLYREFLEASLIADEVIGEQVERRRRGRRGISERPRNDPVARCGVRPVGAFGWCGWVGVVA
jgi:hypothetical protein